MHTFNETGTGVPAFLAKLWRLVEDPETNHLIYWNRDGRSFIIQNQAQFARELLPMNYKHNNMASFIRQLNMYGFHKITSIDNGGLKFDRDEMEFSHPCFKRGYPYLLEHIKRKIATAKTLDEKSSLKPEAVSKVLNEVKVMRGRQDSLDSRFSAMKQENEALWREIAVLRQKHMKQQQIVNKLIQFLVTIVQPSSRNMTGVKRNFQLMINDVPQSSKVRKRTSSNSGPVIHELTEELLDEVAHNDDDLMPQSPNVMSPSAGSCADPSEINDDIARPGSTLSVGSFPESNHGEDFLPSPSTHAPSTSQITDPETEPVVYHITELPETSSYEEATKSPVTQRVMLRASTRRGRKRKHTETESSESASTDQTSKATQSNKKKQTETGDETVVVKTEKDINPLSFLSDPNQVDQVEVDPQLMDVLTATVDGNDNSGLIARGSGTSNDNQTYINQNDFINQEMPADLFEQETSIPDDFNLASGAYNENLDFLKSQNNSPVTESNDASTSKSVVSTGRRVPDLPRSLSITKYSNDDILRFNSPRDITTHLDTVQGDLDTLKDLLRADNYTFDANTLLNNQATNDRITLHPSFDSEAIAKLFGDSDVLGLSGLPTDQQSLDVNKKGNELMTYQPSTYYAGDLSDMLNLDSETLPKTTEYDEKQNGNTSTLNTPMPERD